MPSATVERFHTEIMSQSRTLAMTHGGWIDGIIRDCEYAGQEQFLGLAVVEIQNLESVRQVMGANDCDRVLYTLRARLRLECGPRANFSRYRGDRYYLSLPGCDPNTVRSFLSKLLHRMNVTPFLIGDQMLNLHLEGGVVVWNGLESGETLLARAESALNRRTTNFEVVA